MEFLGFSYLLACHGDVLASSSFIIAEAKRQFKKYKVGEGDTLRMAYDPDSIMHYSNKAFTKNGRNTITYKKNPSQTLGQRDHLSKIDIAQLNRLYRLVYAHYFIRTIL